MCILDEKISMKYIVDLTIQRYAFYFVLSPFTSHFLHSSDFFSTPLPYILDTYAAEADKISELQCCISEIFRRNRALCFVFLEIFYSLSALEKEM